MSTGRKRKDEQRKSNPIRHCVEGHCVNPMRKGFEWAMCRHFMKNMKGNKTPSSCPYYRF